MSARDWLRLARAPLAPTAAFDAVACAMLARGPGFSDAPPALPSVASFAALAATSMLVYVAGMAGNDLADRRRDATIAPDRPIPSGRIRPAGAAVFVLLCAAGAIALGGGPDGDRRAVATALLAAAAYDGLLKRFAVPGALAMGVTRAANAATGVLALVLAGRVSALALLAPAAIGLYSVAITLLSTTEGRSRAGPRIASRALSFVAFGLAAGASWLGAGRPSLGALVAASALLSIAFGRVPKPGPVKRQVLEMLLGLYVLDACVATGHDATSAVVALGSIAAAFLFVYLSQVAVRALRPAGPPAATSAPEAGSPS